MTQAERQTALTLARETIRCHLAGEPLPPVPSEGVFGQNGAAFVTLHTKQGHNLRGCIGTIIAYRPLGEDIAEHAVDAAVGDPRFNAMTAAELDGIEIEISVLSEPKELTYEGAPELLDALRPGIDGVVIKYDGYSATFLPTVWEQLPDKALFLAHLCQKAGLPHDFYQSGKLTVYLYQSEVFSEV
jgi:AmmeMemoRadiSam system protein A